MSRVIMLAWCFVLLLFCNELRAETITYECMYDKEATIDGVRELSDIFRLTFMIDTSAKKAYMIGNNGASEVSVVRAGIGITFVEITGGQSVQVTAISNSGLSSHSRSTFIFKELVPSQMYGVCDVK